jgi:hypothetical protein
LNFFFHFEPTEKYVVGLATWLCRAGAGSPAVVANWLNIRSQNSKRPTLNVSGRKNLQLNLDNIHKRSRKGFDFSVVYFSSFFSQMKC